MLKSLCVFLSILILFSSCGTAYIVTDKGNDIYINGEKKGTEKVEITRNGGPKKSLIEIKQGHKIVNSLQINRKFTFATFICTLLYGVGLGVAWQYPKTTFVEGKEKKSNNGESIWSKPPDKKSIWQ